jgi:DHA1 family multidrug resistance protein-like MFS transporter
VSGWRRTFYTVCAAQFLAFIAFSLALPFLPLYIQRLGVPDPRAAARWAGAMTSGSGLVMAVLAPVWGSIADRYGRKPMVARAMLGGGAVIGLMSLTHSPWQLLGLRTLQGAFSGTVSASRTLVASVVPASELGFALGMLQTSSFVGNSAGPLLGGLVADHVGYRVTFVITAALMFVAGFAVIVLVHEDFTPPPPVAPSERGWRRSVQTVTDVPGLSALILTLFFVQAGVTAVSPVLALFVGSLLPGGGGSVASLAGVILGATAVTSAVAATFAGKLGDRLGHHRMIAVCSIGGGLLYLPQALVTAPWQLLALRAALGLFDGGLMPSVMATIALRSPPARRGWIFGLTATATSLGNAAGPAAGAVAASAFGLRASFVLTSAVLTAAGVWAGFALASRPGTGDGTTAVRVAGQPTARRPAAGGTENGTVPAAAAAESVESLGERRGGG